MGVRMIASSSVRSLRHRLTLAVAEGVVTCCAGRSTMDELNSEVSADPLGSGVEVEREVLVAQPKIGRLSVEFIKTRRQLADLPAQNYAGGEGVSLLVIGTSDRSPVACGPHLAHNRNQNALVRMAVPAKRVT